MQKKIHTIIHGVVLAGGQSRRMGTDKAMLSLKGKTLLATKVNQLEAVLASPCYVSGYYPAFRCIADKGESHGPLSGILSCLEALEGDACLIVPVDMPLLSNQVIDCLVQHYTDQPANYSCLNSVFPLVVQANASNIQLLKDVLDYSEQKQRSIKAFLSLIQATAVDLPQAMQASLINTNTPEQWQFVVNSLGEN
ncbi:molybdenum cofactor guanylyltransferase [Agarivorans sp. MS3-6]